MVTSEEPVRPVPARGVPPSLAPSGGPPPAPALLLPAAALVPPVSLFPPSLPDAPSAWANLQVPVPEVQVTPPPAPPPVATAAMEELVAQLGSVWGPGPPAGTTAGPGALLLPPSEAPLVSQPAPVAPPPPTTVFRPPPPPSRTTPRPLAAAPGFFSPPVAVQPAPSG